MPEILKKLTARTVGCLTEPGQSFVLLGRVMRAVPGSSQFGEFIVFKGQFQAINEVTGGEFTATQAIAPSIGEDMLYNAVREAQGDDKNAMVEIAMRFKTVEVDRAKAPMGYEWRCEPLVEASTDDPLSRLRDTISGKLQLPKPEKGPAKK